jgi:hypothetical protein
MAMMQPKKIQTTAAENAMVLLIEKSPGTNVIPKDISDIPRIAEMTARIPEKKLTRMKRPFSGSVLSPSGGLVAASFGWETTGIFLGRYRRVYLDRDYKVRQMINIPVTAVTHGDAYPDSDQKTMVCSSIPGVVRPDVLSEFFMLRTNNNKGEILFLFFMVYYDRNWNR